MNPYFLIGLVFSGLFIWTVGAYSFWRISRNQKAHAVVKESQPAFRLAEQWIAESQRKMENLVQRSEQPLSTAQNELLELRLEAGRLPQGIKSLKLVRESLAGPLKPFPLRKSLLEIAGLYLDRENFRAGEGPLVFLQTPLGEMPCLEAGKPGSPLGDGDMKEALGLLSRALSRNPATGGFLYFGEDGQYQACLANPEWMDGLKSHRLMILDFRGLTALLVSLRLSKDVERVLQTFEQGVRSTLALTGQSDKMNDALSALSAHSLKTRTVMEGNPPGEPKVSP